MSVEEAIDIPETIALMRYASYLGLDEDHAVIAPLCETVRTYQRTEDDKEKEDIACEMLKQYAALCKLTHPVNGGTLIDTENIWKHTWPIVFLTFVFLVLGFGNEVLDVYFSDLTKMRSPVLSAVADFQNYVMDYLSPFFWGGLGSCVYLLKKLSDRASERTFYSKILHGWGIRILLGAILGSIVQYLYDPSSLTDGQIRLDANAVAFLVGVGTKVVYGAIEKTIVTLAEKMNLAALRGGRDDSAVIGTYLSNKLAKTDEAREPEKRKMIKDLIDELDRQQTT